ncbi:alpha/beta fold hydrolase [Actinokineospora xionganensis]|uniref:Alpha/beta hydrolase n=1 Tax=Actinokineospora xionganensis TaxID=2684470 RepID=A0ABR7L489_9PSEU|nr:alpha/beta hydrolase [Actinokineospora xionganensis]MBC6447474.1 alpha/beta hydrolase [Actinokineospora xionganensis]
MSLATEVERPVVLRRHTTGDRARLLLLHGLANSATVWHGFVERADPDLDIWSADLPWRGEGVAGWSDRGDLPGWVAEALRAVPGGAGVVVAHSFSANLLLALLDRELAAGLDPFDRYGIHGLVLVSPFYRTDPAAFEWADISRYLNDFHLIMEDGIRVHAAGRISDRLCRDMAYRVRDQVGPYGWTRFFQTYLDTPWLRTEAMRVPCLVLSGEDDFAALPGEAVELAARLPDARARVLPGCGHFLMSEQPANFAAVIAEFAGALPTGGRPASGSRPVGEHIR